MMTKAQEQVEKPWSEQKNAVDYLRKLMVEHFGLSIHNPEEVDQLWQEGYNPPQCFGERLAGPFSLGIPSARGNY